MGDTRLGQVKTWRITAFQLPECVLSSHAQPHVIDYVRLFCVRKGQHPQCRLAPGQAGLDAGEGVEGGASFVPAVPHAGDIAYLIAKRVLQSILNRLEVLL